MRFPKNQIKENLYTSGGEFINTASNAPYSGYYWENNGRYFIGKTSDVNSIELRKTTPSELKKLSLINLTPNNFILNKQSKQLIENSNSIPGIPSIKTLGNTRYFAKQTNVYPTLIKEISKDTFEQIQSNPIYKTISINDSLIYQGSEALENAELRFTGLKSFLFKELNSF